MQKSKVMKMLAGVAALSSVANAGEVMGMMSPHSRVVPPVKGAAFEANGKDTVKVRFDGRTEFDYNTKDADGFEFRRLRLGAKGTLGSGIFSETVLEMAEAGNSSESGGGDLEFHKAIVGYDITPTASVQAGYDKVVFGFEETSSSGSGVFIERSRLNDRLDGEDATGSEGKKSTNFYDRKLNITGKTELGGGFSVAASLADSREAGLEPAYYGQVRWSQDDIIVGVDYADNNDLSGYTLYANYNQKGGLNALVEYFDADLGETPGGGQQAATKKEADGYAVRVSYRFGDFEPVVRYSDYTYNGSDDNELLLGCNYYVAPQVTFLAGYVQTEEKGIDDDYVIGRLRVLW
jgi:phosphate-selective porin